MCLLRIAPLDRAPTAFCRGNASEAHINFGRGNALAALSRKAEAAAAWKLVADKPESKDAKIEEARKKAKEALATSGTAR